jgi:DNA-directed RNA polymerase subunit RPC12/RpoP
VTTIEYECMSCGRPREAEPGSVCRTCGEPRRLVKVALRARVTASGAISGLVTNFVYVMRPRLVAAAVAVEGAASTAGSILKARFTHHGPVIDVAADAADRGGEAAAEWLMRRAWTRVKRTSTFEA